MTLYTYVRSSAAYRVRIMLALKGLAYDPAFVHLLRDGGEQLKPDFAAINPMKLVPALATPDGVLTQSIAIGEYLEERHPDPALLPTAAGDRAYVRAVAAGIACDIHPLNNLRVLRYLTGPMGLDAEARDRWYRHWIAEGLAGIEALVAGSGKAGAFCCGDRPTLADVFLVPQMVNARRFDCPLEAFPTLVAIDERAAALPAFQAAAPAMQGDFEG